MEANELRIGNLVTLSDAQRKELWANEILATNDYFKVDSVSSDGIVYLKLDDETIDFEVKDISPIELTEELLLNKCGFKRADKNDSYGGILSPDLPNGNRMRLVNLEWRTKHYTTKFETLHHFQNWWYDNFQTELEINL